MIPSASNSVWTNCSACRAKTRFLRRTTLARRTTRSKSNRHCQTVQHLVQATMTVVWTMHSFFKTKTTTSTIIDSFGAQTITLMTLWACIEFIGFYRHCTAGKNASNSPRSSIDLNEQNVEKQKRPTNQYILSIAARNVSTCDDICAEREKCSKNFFFLQLLNCFYINIQFFSWISSFQNVSNWNS